MRQPLSSAARAALATTMLASPATIVAAQATPLPRDTTAGRVPVTREPPARPVAAAPRVPVTKATAAPRRTSVTRWGNDYLRWTPIVAGMTVR